MSVPSPPSHPSPPPPSPPPPRPALQVVMGASLFAANLSTSFRLRKFGMTDLSMYGISLKMEEVGGRERWCVGG